MKIIKALALASALSPLALSLTGCADSAQSQPQTIAASKAPDYWSTRIGQQCSVLFSNKASTNMSVRGDLKSVTDSWVVVGDVLETALVDGKSVGIIKEYCIPIENISYLSFSKPQNAN